MDQNACAECGFTTADLAEFTRHVERHENGGGPMGTVGKKQQKEVKRPRKGRREAEEPAAEERRQFQLQLDLAEEEENAQMLGLADLSRFLSAAAENCPEDAHSAAASLSPMSTNNHSALEDSANQIEDEEEQMEAEEDHEEQEKPSPHSASSSRSKKGRGNGGGGGKTTHRCPHCTFTTYMSQHMKSHLRAHDNFVGQMYICDVCGMAFSQKANMHRHRGTHSGVKPYECRFCQKKFFRKDQMQEHSMTHIKTGDDFDCPVSGCEQKFSQHTMLRQHLDHSHQIASSQQAKCKRCTLQFSNSRRLLLHYQTKHDEYYCSVSPVPEGQSPVKRLNGHAAANGHESSQSPRAPELSPVKRKSRKRPRRSNNNNDDDGSLATIIGAKKMAIPNPSTPSNSMICNGAAAGGGGYNVEELLKLDCATGGERASASASVSPATFEQRQTAATNWPKIVERAPSQCSSANSLGFDLFRDHLFRTCSSAALFAQFGAKAGGGIPTGQSDQQQHQNQQQQAAAAAAMTMASAAAAQLFMQSLMLHQPPLKMNKKMEEVAEMVPKQERRATPPPIAMATKHLPLAKSPDCRGLILNGFKSTSSASKGEEAELANHPTIGKNNLIGDGEASESEEAAAPMELDANDDGDGTSATSQMTVKEANKKRQLANVAKNASNCAAKSQPSGGHCSSSASTTHSPSSSSTASSSSTLSVDGVGSATSSANESPLKLLNGLSASSGLLSRALLASEGLLKEALDQPGDMDCAHCGLLFADQTLYLLHKGLHSETDPWRCNLCGQRCNDKYTFTTHIVSSDHS